MKIEIEFIPERSLDPMEKYVAVHRARRAIGK